MSEGQIRMTAAEYREAMGLDPVKPKTIKGTITEQKKPADPAPGAGFNKGMERLFLRLLWLAAWAWMIFTFGWVGHVIVRLTERRLNDGV